MAAGGVAVSPLQQTTLAGGLRGTLFEAHDLLPDGHTSLVVNGAGSFASSSVAGAEMLLPLTARTLTLRLSLEGRHEQPLGSVGLLTPVVEAGVRQDGGDGLTGHGVEVGGSVKYQHLPWGLTLQGRGRVLVTHAAERAEWGVGGLVLVQPGAGGRGLALSVAPEWGEPRSGVPELWQRGARALPAITTSGGRVTAELGFGVATAGGTGLLTPFAGLTLAPEGMHSYRAGTHLTIGDGVGVSVQAEHRQQAGEPPERVLKLVGRIDLEVDDER